MAGRTVVVPDEIETVFSSSTVTAIFMYTLAPDKLLGWNYELNELEKSIILEEYHDLPNFGMGDSINYEAVIAADPPVIQPPSQAITSMNCPGALPDLA